MVAIAREQENTSSLINWYTTVNGVLTDMYEVGFKILDLTAGLPGTQIFPATEGNYEDATNAPGKFSTGSYYAYDNTAGAGWTPSAGANIGTWKICWRWKRTASSPYQEGGEEFEMLASSAGSSVDTYCSVADIRSHGVTVAMADDDTVLSYLKMTQALLERATRQWFTPRALTLLLNGNDSYTLFFGIPIITIDYVKLNNSTQELETNLYRVYNSRSYPDDRRNPRIRLIQPYEYRDIYSQPNVTQLRFLKGAKNQEVKGTFGYVEEDGTVPLPIKRAHCKLTVEKLGKPLVSDPTGLGPTLPSILGPLLEEETDDHRVKYGAVGGGTTARRPGLSGITQDPEILDIIKLYKAPLGLATPAHWGHM
jgi:hypothetical protein